MLNVGHSYKLINLKTLNTGMKQQNIQVLPSVEWNANCKQSLSTATHTSW